MTRFALGMLLSWTAACTPTSPAEAPSVATAPASAPVAEPTQSVAPLEPIAKPIADPIAKPIAPEPTPPVVEPDTRVFVEALGGLRLGMTRDELRAVMPTLVTDGKVTQVTPDSITPGPRTYYVQSFRDDAAGVWIETRSKTADGPKRASSISFDRQSTARTKKGIGIGSTRAQLRKAYPKVITPIDEMWVRFSDDEMLTFIFDEKRRVEGMTLGPAMDPDDLEE